MSANRMIVGSTAAAGVLIAAVAAWFLRPAPDAPAVATPAPTLVPTPTPTPAPAPTPAPVPAPTAQPAPEPADQPEIVADVAPQIAPDVTPDLAAASPQAATVSPPVVTDLLFDDTGAVVSGRAAPGAAVTLRVDGVGVADVVAEADGSFVAIFFLEPVARAQVLTLEMALADGSTVPGAEATVLLPRMPLIAAAPEPAPRADGGAADAPMPMAQAQLPEAQVPAEAAPARTSPLATGSPSGPDPVRAGATPDQPDLAMAEPAAAPDTGPVPEIAAGPAPSVVSDLAALESPEPAIAQSVTQAAPGSTPAEPLGPAPTALVLRADGAVDLAGLPTRGLENVVIDSISYATGGAVVISGRASARTGGDEAALRLYLDNRPVAEGRAQAGFWRLELSDVVPGLYTLRVDQLDASEVVVSRFETPFLRETPENIARMMTGSAPAQVPDAPMAEVPAPVEPAPAPVAEAPAPAPAPVAEVPAPAEPAPAPVAEAPAPAEPAPAPVAEASAPVEPAPAPMAEAPAPVEPAPAPVAAAPAPVEPAPAPMAEVPAPAEPAPAPMAEVPAPAEPAPAPVAAAPAPAEPAPAPVAAAPAPVEPAPAPVAAAPAPVEPAPAPVAAAPEPAPAAVPRVTAVTVQPGNTLWAISREHYGEGIRYVQIFEANRGQIRNPDLIYPGQVFTLPE